MTALPDIRKTVVLNAPIEKVWNAVATSEGIAAWWMPNTFAPALGHEFILHAGTYGDSLCTVIALEPPRRLEFTWGKDWHLAFELREMDGKTEQTLIQSGWDSEKVTEFNQPHPAIRGFMESDWGDLAALRGFVES